MFPLNTEKALKTIFLYLRLSTGKRMANIPTELQYLGRWCPRIFKRTRSHLRSLCRTRTAYLKGVLTRLPTQRASEIDQLLPHEWMPT